MVFDSPLADLLATPEAQAAGEELTRLAVAVPAMARLRQVVAFVGKGRPATQAGNLKPADAVALAERLATGERVPAQYRSIDDLPDTAHAFRWAAAAEFLAWRGTKVVAGPAAADFERDPLSAWIRATITLLEHGPLDGFRQGWRKSYVELIDANAPALLLGMAAAGGTVSSASIADAAWPEVAAAYGYEPDNDTERRHVAKLMKRLVDQFADIGVVVRRGDDVALTELGDLLAAVVAFSTDDESDDLDLVDTDAQSLLMVCVEEMEPEDARGHLLAWCEARPAEEAAAELCEAMVDDDDPAVWELGFEALAMIDRAVAETAVRALRSRPGLRPMATAWLRAHPPTRTRPSE